MSGTSVRCGAVTCGLVTGGGSVGNTVETIRGFCEVCEVREGGDWGGGVEWEGDEGV